MKHESEPVPKSTYHHKGLRRSLLDAVLQLVKENGVSRCTLREAAKRAGVSHNAPYRHFTSREHLLAELAAEGHRELVQRLRDGISERKDPRERLLILAESYVQFAMSQTALFQVMYSHEHVGAGFEELATAQAETMAFFLDEIASGEKAGVIQQASLDHALAGWAAMHGLSVLLIDRVLEGRTIAGDRTPKDLARAVIQPLMDGLDSSRMRSKKK